MKGVGIVGNQGVLILLTVMNVAKISAKKNCIDNNKKKGEVAQYQGETGKNGFKRGKYLKKKDIKESILWLHSLHHHHHQGREEVRYSMTVTGSYKEPLDRQIMEKVQISGFKGDIK